MIFFVPVFSLRPMKEPFPVGVKVKALKQTYTTKYYEQATVKSRQPNGFYELSFGYAFDSTKHDKSRVIAY